MSNSSNMSNEQKLADSIGEKIEFRRIFVNGYDINYVVAGSGHPVILIHGGNLGWGQWYPNIAPLAKHFTVYAIDLPGGGRSTKIDFDKFDFEKDLLNTVIGFIEEHKFPSVDVIGSSNGGWITLRLGLNKKLPIRKLVVADGVGFSDYVSLADRIISMPGLAHFLARSVFKPERKNKRIETLLRSVFHDRNISLKQEFVEYFYETMSQSHNLLFINRLINENRKRTLSLRDRLPQIAHDTLIIWGERDKLMPIAKYAPNFSFIPNVKVHIIKDAGHIPSLEKSEEWNREVINFLRR